MTNKPEVVGAFDGLYIIPLKPMDKGDQLIRQSDHIAEVSKMVEALKVARDALAFAVRNAAPEFFETDEDVAQHSAIKLIDEALGGKEQ